MDLIGVLASLVSHSRTCQTCLTRQARQTPKKNSLTQKLVDSLTC